MQVQYKFRPIPKRDDISEIKQNARRDSVNPKEIDDHWSTLYHDTYIRHPLNFNYKTNAPPEGISIGGGNLEPDAEEMKTDYQRTYKRFDRSDVPKRADPLPCSDIIKGDEPIPESTCHAALKEANEGRPPYDNAEAKARKAEGVSSHFYFGSDPKSFDTTYNNDFIERPIEKPPTYNLELQKSHVEFDKSAGLGPHQKARSNQKAKQNYPQVADAKIMDMNKANFDIGYDKPNYQTTMGSSLYKPSKLAGRPETFKAPPCAVLSDHGDAGNSSMWKSNYTTDFTNRQPIPNPIDKAQLRDTHFDPGHEKNEWPDRNKKVETVRPERLTVNLQESNIVFKGDGQGRYQTTSSDLIGNYDRTKDGRGKFVDARDDHLFLGQDNPDYSTTAKDFNKLAGTGKPAEKGVDLHHLRGVGFATGGTFDPYYEEKADQKKEVRYGPTVKVDPTYFTSSHFELNSTGAQGNDWGTTYFEEICRPKIY
ncbi:hypothetical protein TVAG_092040 [Trichomonas vaginalis G3]|uniref:Uncharacterized protein n=1 Tax=Trichomonas vaginalis (strain ATCC PRA-98 / G3) TaxID=412133 RepID=A2FN69_TRIV3|nr:hypothetical protein TVAGG3_0585170 [Trichomonas vaginalis G3]EAX93669.1 hypothetical protein TVAG_092040 [Trichomonas vaginalis G3]KAI5522833.1 hypothetical protein TVAGG3_0585170 [Trichomonas vaginalis G3]|eukprot:XP_001306599.1 hypothetical protein [Trichomonas vaginalis G3]